MYVLITHFNNSIKRKLWHWNHEAADTETFTHATAAAEVLRSKQFAPSPPCKHPPTDTNEYYVTSKSRVLQLEQPQSQRDNKAQHQGPENLVREAANGHFTSVQQLWIFMNKEGEHFFCSHPES